jgi:hypothetical protein
MDAEKVTFQLKSSIFGPEKLTFLLKMSCNSAPALKIGRLCQDRIGRGPVNLESMVHKNTVKEPHAPISF